MNAELAPAPAAADANNDHGHDHPAPSAGVAAQSDGQHARTQADVVSDDNQLLPDSDSICRVCRSPATPDDPLFHPCKCSGSMRFVHQQCLEDWLSHSGKRHCEICNHVFVFTPIYAESAPASVSASTVVSVVVQRLVAAATFSMRVVLAVVAWLVWVPYVTVWTWRLFLSPALIAERLMTTNSTFTLHYQLAQYIFNDTFAGSTSLVTILDGADWAKEWSATAKSLMADVFEGQKIASLAIVVGLSLVCIKEYIVLNTPRGPDGRPMLHPDDVDPDVALDADFHGLENPLDLHAPDAPDAGVDAQLDQLDGLELVQEAAAMDIIHADGQMRNDDHEQQEPDRRNVPPEPHLDGDHQNGQGEPAAWQSNAHGPPDGSDVQASSFTQHLRESPLASHALLHSREASDGVHSTQAVSPALSSRSSQHFYAHMDSQTDATSWSASFAQDSHPSGAPRDSVRHEFTYMRHFNQTHSTEFVSSSDEADIEMLPNDVSPGSSSGYGTPDAPRYYLRSRIDHPHSVAGSSSSLDEQVPRASSFSGSGSNERIVAPLPRSRASSGTDIPRFSLRRKASSRSTTVSSANSPASPVGVTAHPLPSAEDLQRRYADEMAALESEVDRRRLKGKQSACSGDDEPAGNAYPPFPPSSDDALVSASLQNARFRRDSGSDGQQHASSSQDTSDSAKPTSLRGSARSSASDSRHLSSSAPTPPTRITSGFREARDTYSSSRSSSRSSVDSTNPDWRDSLANLARRERESSAEVSRSLASSQSSSAVTNQALLSSSLVNAVAARPIERTRFSLRKNASDNHDEQSSLLAIGTSLPQQQQQQHDAHLDGVDGDTDTDTDPVARAESQLASGSIIAEDKCLPDALPPGPAHGRAHLQETQDGDALHGTVEHMPPNLQQLRQDHPILQDAQAWQERDIAGQLDAEQPEQQLEQQLEQQPEQQPQPQGALAGLAAQLFGGPLDQPADGDNDAPEAEAALNVNLNFAINDGNIVAEVNANGDINAFLDMVGIQGPVSFLIYNLFLVHILVFAAIAVGVWLPFITGKLGLWIVQDVYAPVMESGVHHVTRLLQAVTDPILDPIVDGLIVLSTWLSDGSSKTPALDASALRVTNATANVRAAGQATIVRNATLYSTAVAADMAKTTAAPGSASFGSLAPIISFLEPLFGKAVPATAAIASEQMASPPDAFGPLLESLMKDPLILTSIGYMMYLALFFYYARQTGLIYHPYAQTTRRLVASVARYVYLAHKFSFFIVIELGMFPVFCGILVDICTLLVFGSGASVMQSRIVFYEQHPYTSIFLHWLIGTMFMFQVSMYISTVREVVRPGVMWFIRDPNDPHFNPMNEILERPILVQLRKLAIGTLLYASLVVGIVGGSVSTIYAAQTLLGFKQGTAKILPLRWEFHDHFSDFPIDLLVFHFLVPNVLKAIKPMVVFQSMLEFWFQCVARALRLTSFLFGGDFPDEESDWEDNDVHHDTAGAGVPLVRHLFAANDAHRGFAPLPQRPGAGDLFVAEVLANGDVVPIDQDDDEGEWEDEDEDVDTEANPVRHADIVGDGLFDGHNRLAGHVDNPGSGDMGTGQMEHGGTDLAAADEQQGIGANGITVGDGPAASTPGSVGGASQQGTRPVKPKREKRFMRVPNHDHVEIIPGQKMMVMMREEDPVFGRETESPDEVAANWTKVYTPDNFQKRIIVLLLLQWLSLVLLIVVIWVVPLVVGRLLFAAMNAHTIVTIAVPAAFGYTLPQPVPRADLPINDIYAYFGGVIFCFIASYPVQLGYSLVKKWTQLSRRNAIRRKRQPLGVRDQNRRRGRNAIGGLVGAVDTDVPANMSLATPIAGRAAERQESLWRRALQDGVWWWTRYGKQQAIRVYKALYLFFWVGCVVPLLFGLMVDIYVLTPFKGHPECTSVVFFIQDWAMGGILLKIAYNIILAGPESRIRQVLSQASQAGLRLDLGPISRELIFPMVAFTSFCLPLPTIGIYVEKSFGLSPYTVRDYFLRLGVPMLVLVLVANELLHGLGRVVRRWLDQIKDEQYLVGRRLHNVDDAIVVAATAAAAAAAPTAPPPPQPIVAPIQDQDEWVDDQ